MENRRGFYVGLACLVVAAASFAGYRLWDERAREKASLAYGLARTASPDGRGEAVETALQKVAADYPRSRPGLLARLRLAALLRERKEYRDARAQYELVARSGAALASDRELARRGLASVLMLEGACADAVAIWKSILEKGSLFAPEDLYLSIAACQETLGKPENARNTYEELSRKHPESPFLSERIRSKLSANAAGQAAP